jgi:hypothetical protein
MSRRILSSASETDAAVKRDPEYDGIRILIPDIRKMHPTPYFFPNHFLSFFHNDLFSLLIALRG